MLEIPLTIFRQMVEQAKTEAPIEACGILAGSNGTVQRLYKMRNVDKSSDHFMMEPKEQFAVVKDIRSTELVNFRTLLWRFLHLNKDFSVFWK
jgi:proteasome lid subunit RPN8/RPN11